MRDDMNKWKAISYSQTGKFNFERYPFSRTAFISQ